MFEMTPTTIGIMVGIFLAVCVIFAVMIKKELK